MGEKIDQFCNELREELTAADNRLQYLKVQVENANRETRNAIQAKLDQAKADLEEQQRKAEDRRHEVRRYFEEKVAEAEHDIGKKRREVKELEKHAQRRERYAADTVLFAMASIDEATVAILEALAARLDVEDAEAASA
jgi:hypothetical protein